MGPQARTGLREGKREVRLPSPPSLKPYNPGMIAARSRALWGDRSQCWAAGARTAAWDSCSGRAGLGGREAGTGPSPVPTGPLGGGGGAGGRPQSRGKES